jgi:cysteine synthase
MSFGKLGGLALVGGASYLFLSRKVFVSAEGEQSHYELLVVGGGTGGLTVANQIKQKRPSMKMALVEPSDIHHYQPGWTMVAGGLLNWEKTRDQTKKYIPSGVLFTSASFIRQILFLLF